MSVNLSVTELAIAGKWMENTAVSFKMDKNHPLYKLKPKNVDWAVWIRGRFVYSQYQVIRESKTTAKK